MKKIDVNDSTESPWGTEKDVWVRGVYHDPGKKDSVQSKLDNQLCLLSIS